MMENKNLAPYEPVVREGAPTPSNANAEPSAAFTPGPWFTKPSSVSDNLCVYSAAICDEVGGYGIGEAWNINGDPQNAANARLIAAAPELLEALKELWLRTTVGTDAERVAALTAAGNLLARLGALEATGADQ